MTLSLADKDWIDARIREAHRKLVDDITDMIARLIEERIKARGDAEPREAQ